ncbi:MAG: cobalt-precorrin-5B (C(1))-methyltransferase CbiD [Elainella sp. Prado103]|jgi:cobalt-precorrin-5B (C1)-methyltransferase|nr:cobalt-precorrin-5B (C(1))-methyltransferase CbiD [Elainella sp. Prado103]
MARSGYTLPVFAVAAAKAAWLHRWQGWSKPVIQVNLQVDQSIDDLTNPPIDQSGGLPIDQPGDPRIDSSTNISIRIPADFPVVMAETEYSPELLGLGSAASIPADGIPADGIPADGAKIAQIPVQQVANLDSQSALAITLSDPGDNLDLTRNTPIWAWVQVMPRQTEALILAAGEGLGKSASGDPAIYRFARQLFEVNLLPLIPADRSLRVTIIFPEGQQLAQRTSNEAFGILEGLALLGTSGISRPLSAEEHLADLQQQLHSKVATQPDLIFCIGSNGMQVAERLGLPAEAIVQTGNWIGAMLLEAGMRGARSVLLLGYQGKLVKLAGGIYNTSSHLADAKLEIIAAALAQVGGDRTIIQAVLTAKTADQAHQRLIEANWADAVFQALAEKVTQRATAYVRKYGDVDLTIGTVLFDRKGGLIAQDTTATQLVRLQHS